MTPQVYVFCIRPSQVAKGILALISDHRYQVKHIYSKAYPERIGRPRIYYALTAEGKKSLWKAHELQRTIWDSIPDFIGGPKS